jgi:hypothetical protein
MPCHSRCTMEHSKRHTISGHCASLHAAPPCPGAVSPGSAEEPGGSAQADPPTVCLTVRGGSLILNERGFGAQIPRRDLTAVAPLVMVWT